MEVLTKQQTVKGPEQWFTGDVWFDVIARGEGDSRIRANAVHFAPCARRAHDPKGAGSNPVPATK